jgi:proteic killer suppression protein
MIVSFKDEGTRDIWYGEDTRAARKTCPNTLWGAALKRLSVLNRVRGVDELRFPPGNRLEVLRRDRAGQHSIRINRQYRICFRWVEKGPVDVEIADYH